MKVGVDSIVSGMWGGGGDRDEGINEGLPCRPPDSSSESLTCRDDSPCSLEQ